MSDPAVILDPAAASVPAPEAVVDAAPPVVIEETVAAVTETAPAPAATLLAPDVSAAEPAATETPAADPAAAPTTEKPAEAAPPVVDPAAPVVDPVAAPVAEPAETPALPTYEPFTLPEDFTVDNAGMEKFTGVIGELKLDQAGGQKLMDLYTAETARLMEAVTEHQWQVFEDTKRQWVKEFEEDPEIGRNRQETSIREARDVVKWGFGVGGPGWGALSDEERAARTAKVENFYTKLGPTGFQNNPESVRLLVGLHRHLAPFFKEPETPPPGGAPRGAASLTPAQKRYGNTGA